MSDLPPIQRVVTGHDHEGNAIVIENGPLPTVTELKHIPGTVFHEVWQTMATPVPLAPSETDPTLAPIVLPPPPNGTRIRFVDIPPDTEDFLKNGAQRMSSMFSSIGDAHASTVGTGSAPHPLMHRTESIDYGIVIEGELVLVLDKGEVELKPGAVVIQRGTNHAWANRSDKPCRILFVLVSGQYAPDLASALQAR